jgi:phosphate transport system substrate-binding protein
MKTTFKFAAAGLIAAAFAHVPAFAQEATGAGASFPAPLYSKWAADFNKATGAKINYQSVGSGAGIKQIDAKTVDFGASDMPLSDEELKTKGLMQFPTVIGGVIPVVNIQGIKPGDLQLSGHHHAQVLRLGLQERRQDRRRPGLRADARQGEGRDRHRLG